MDVTPGGQTQILERAGTGVRPAALDVSVVIPVHNEKDTLPALHQRLTRVLRGLDVTYEILFVNDGSTDGSGEVLASLCPNDPKTRVIELRKNFGKATALSSGFWHARGQAIVTMDADLQEDPEEIPRFLERLRQGYDLVVGWRFPRQDTFSKRVQSWIYNRLASLVSGTSLHDMNCGFKAYRREVVQTVRLYGELHRYIPILAQQYGFRIDELTIRHHPRQFGKSKYSFHTRWPGVLDLVTVVFITRFDRKPLHLLGGVGLAWFGAGFLICLYLSWLSLFGGQFIRNRPLLLLGVMLMMLGLQLFFFGLLAEMFIHYHHRNDEGYIRTILETPQAPGEGEP
ncbi:MAG: glycosyltransferase family 2 protein [Armatimonadetes bacterium]|nr:glycosyltransferase family 2 protein [Armatimonadota bacterium]